MVVCSSLLVIVSAVLDKRYLEKNSIRTVVPFTISLVVLLLSIIFSTIQENPDGVFFNQIALVVKFILFFMVLWLVGEEREKIIAHICSIIYWLSCLSLLLLVMKYVFGTDFLPVFQVGLVKTSFISTYYGTDIGLSGVVRNSSIFYEPGLYSAMLAFSFCYFYARNGFSNRCKVLYLSCITTLSPLGFLLINTVLIFDYWNRSLLLRVFVVASAFSLVWILTEFVLLKAESLSFLYRVEDIKVGLDIFVDNFFFGVGLFNDETMKAYFNRIHGGARGSSNGFISLLYQTGIFWAALFFIFVSRALQFFFVKSHFMAAFILVVTIVFQPIQYSNFFILLFAMGCFVNAKQKNSFYCT